MEDSIWYGRDKRAITGGITKSGKSISEEGYQYQCNKLGSFSKISGKRNKRSVWIVTTKPFKGAHFATFPEALVEPMIKAGCPQGGIVLDMFAGACTTGVVAKKLNRNFIGIDLNPNYCEMAKKRLQNTIKPMF